MFGLVWMFGGCLDVWFGLDVWWMFGGGALVRKPVPMNIFARATHIHTQTIHY